jgi:hypothetical protein
VIDAIVAVAGVVRASTVIALATPLPYRVLPLVRAAAGSTAPTPGRPATGRPATGRPATGRPATGRPATGQSDAGPDAGQSDAGQSDAGSRSVRGR